MSATSLPSSRRTRARKRLRLRFAKRSSTRVGLLVLAFATGVVLAVVGLAAGNRPLTLAGLALAIALAGVLADFAAREQENARLLEDAQVREVERSRLSDQLITAEQDERRRLANELHDGAVQSLSGVALMLDAGLNSIEEGRGQEAQEIIGRALERHRATIGQLRNLSFNLEPVVLRDQGLAPAVRALTDQIELAHNVQVEIDVEAAEELAEKTQAAIYQIIREAIDQAVHRGPPQTLSVTMRQTADGGVETAIADDAPGERRRRSLEELEERARTLNGVLTVDQGQEAGTTVRVVLPPYATA